MSNSIIQSKTLNKFTCFIHLLLLILFWERRGGNYIFLCLFVCLLCCCFYCMKNNNLRNDNCDNNGINTVVKIHVFRKLGHRWSIYWLFGRMDGIKDRQE